MFELVLVVCLASQPDQCSVERPPSIERFSNATACARDGYVHVVQWLIDHPNWNVRRWQCEQPSA
jgi:hypothetical protein